MGVNIVCEKRNQIKGGMRGKSISITDDSYNFIHHFLSAPSNFRTTQGKRDILFKYAGKFILKFAFNNSCQSFQSFSRNAEREGESEGGKQKEKEFGFSMTARNYDWSSAYTHFISENGIKFTRKNNVSNLQVQTNTVIHIGHLLLQVL